jgi:hypothetical protein
MGKDYESKLVVGIKIPHEKLLKFLLKKGLDENVLDQHYIDNYCVNFLPENIYIVSGNSTYYLTICKQGESFRDMLKRFNDNEFIEFFLNYAQDILESSKKLTIDDILMKSLLYVTF